ncbi:VanZ family protein [Sedimentibacter acidaminivorans]|uniref:VanZ family protein n=1 Tax=Sedimentibacter acidaminivorans TaxID=913099 RepID=A0ABS4G9A8_9FIRM|nr:VanZ family protein [Sedimentibacter acidaminivorans]MBP1924275.1 VanZ family protein [Sedimentibacter acidaminivorans]
MSNNRKLFNAIIAWIPVILWMILIFSLSAQPASQSNGLSKDITKIVINTVGKVVPIDIEISTVTNLGAKLNHIVRKLGHFIEYLVLGVLVINAFKKCGYKNNKILIYSIIFCVLYASSDEIHQLFVPGRGGQVKDVIIDSFGSIVGITINEIIFLIKNKGKNYDNKSIR